MATTKTPGKPAAQPKKKVLLLNGPNLNLLGVREPTVYGATSLKDVETMFKFEAEALGIEAVCFQSNHEGALIDRIHEAGRDCKMGTLLGVVFNPGAYTHTSVALHDAIKGVGDLPVIEVHISNVHQREAFRHHSFISPAAAGIVVGFGVDGYLMALRGLLRKTGHATK